jgi:uncharacterized protein
MAAVETRNASPTVVQFLSRPGSYPHWVRHVEVVETHISWIFLAGKFAYKLKKPVRFEFLDFSSICLRELACFEEVRLNRRLAPDIYIAALPISRESDGTLALDGEGPPIDYVVQMHRLLAEKSAESLIRTERLTIAQVDAISKCLTGYYSNLRPKAIDGPHYRRKVEQHVRANRAALLAAVPEQGAAIRKLHSLQLRFLAVEQKLFDERVAAGRIVEGHGDLRPEHIYVNGRPNIIDCIEFSEELRTVDIVDELSFLQMECEVLGDGGLGSVVLAAYSDECQDFPSQRLLAFYRNYRAAVRAKVAAIRAVQLNSGKAEVIDEIRSYLDLAARSAEKLGPAALIVVSGFMGTGKSTLATKIADAFAVELISTDHIRQSAFGPSASPARYGEGIYQPNLRTQVYDELFKRADVLLSCGETVVLDGTFLQQALRDRAVRLANRQNAICVLVLCQCAKELAITRVQQRVKLDTGESEGRPDLYDAQVREYEPITASDPAVMINTHSSGSRQLRSVFAALRSSLFGR